MKKYSMRSWSHDQDVDLSAVEIVYLASEVDVELARCEEERRDLRAMVLEERANLHYARALRHGPDTRKRRRELRRIRLLDHYFFLIRDNVPGWWSANNRGER
jgi:hypothetical protein